MRLSAEELATKIEAVAKHLPEEWTYQPPSIDEDRLHPQILGPDGAYLWAHQPSYKIGQIIGSIPNMYRIRYVSSDEMDRTRIGVTLSRPADAIAREIIRRLLPGYLPLFRELKEFKEEHERDARDTEALSKRLRRLAPEDVTLNEYSPQQIRLEVKLSESEARTVLDALTAHRTRTAA